MTEIFRLKEGITYRTRSGVRALVLARVPLFIKMQFGWLGVFVDDDTAPINPNEIHGWNDDGDYSSKGEHDNDLVGLWQEVLLLSKESVGKAAVLKNGNIKVIGSYDADSDRLYIGHNEYDMNGRLMIAMMDDDGLQDIVEIV